MKTYYVRRGHPHIQPIGASFSVTLLTHDAIPEGELTALRKEKEMELAIMFNEGYSVTEIQEVQDRYRHAIDQLLIQKGNQEYPLRRKLVAEVIMERLLHYDGRYYELLVACIMPNHIHILFDFSIQVPEDWDGDSDLPKYRNVNFVVGQIKGSSATLVNKKFDRQGRLWRPGYYDRYIRNEQHLENEKNYILRNPSKANLARRWREYPFTYLKT